VNWVVFQCPEAPARLQVKAKIKQSSIKTEQIIRLGFLVVLYWAVYVYFCIYRY
jgi:hypothetical protein